MEFTYNEKLLMIFLFMFIFLFLTDCYLIERSEELFNDKVEACEQSCQDQGLEYKGYINILEKNEVTRGKSRCVCIS